MKFMNRSHIQIITIRVWSQLSAERPYQGLVVAPPSAEIFGCTSRKRCPGKNASIKPNSKSLMSLLKMKKIIDVTGGDVDDCDTEMNEIVIHEGKIM